MTLPLTVRGKGERAMSKRAVLYCRVSTDEQAESGYSLPTQLEACRTYAEENDLEVVAEFAEDFTGTVPIEERPEGSEAFSMLARDEADVLIAYSVSRLVRPPEEGDEWEVPILIRGLAKVGKEIHVSDRGQLSTSFVNLLTAVLEAKSAGDYRRNMLEQCIRGKRGKVKSGRPYCGGHVPYGYKVVPDEKGKGAYFEISETQAEVVRMIYNWYVLGDGDNKPLSMYAITKRLTEMGTPTPGDVKPTVVVRVRKPGTWRDYMVQRILDREAYTGTWYFGSDDIPVSIPAIISQEMFDAVQVQREHNKKMSRRNAKNKYLLRGMVKCGCGCGLTLNGMFNISNSRCYYRCYDRTKAGVEKPRCNLGKIIRADALEHAAWKYILSIMTNSEGLEDRLREAQRLEHEAKQPKRDRLGLVCEMIAEAQKEADKLALALADAPGGIVEASLKRQVTDVNSRHAKLCKERDRLQEQIESQAITDQDIEEAVSFQQAVKVGLQNPTWEDKRYYLERMRFEATVTADTAHFTCYLDVTGSVFDLQASRSRPLQRQVKVPLRR